MATIINLRDYYPWYTHDELVEVPVEIATELILGKRYEKAYEQHMRRNKSFYSLDVGDGIEESSIICYDDSPERVFGMMDRHC